VLEFCYAAWVRHRYGRLHRGIASPDGSTVDREGLRVVPEAGPNVEQVSAQLAHHGAQTGTAPGDHVPGAGRQGTFRALRSRPFRLYFAGQAASASGTFVQQTAIGWLVLRLTGSASELGLVLAVGGVPSLLFGPWGGTVADRVNLRRLLIGTQTAYGVLAGLLWVLAAAGNASAAAIIAISVAGGLVQIIDSPSRQAFISSLVMPDDLSSAASLNGVVMNSARVVGPALAGVLIVTIGTTPCFAINALSYLAVIAALVILRPLRPGTRGHSTGGVRAGLRYAASRQQLWLPLVMMALVGLLAFNFPVILPVLASRTFHGNGGTYGLLTTLLSVGSVAGSLGVGLIRHPRRTYLLVAALAFGAFLAATAGAPDVAVACLTLLATGAAAFSFVTLCSTTLQLHSSAAYRGRIMALWVYVYIGTTPVGSIITGAIISAAGARAALLTGTAACLAAAVIASRVHTPPHGDAALTDLAGG
jgi:predicted MFS family arabinose efflux permease